LTEATPLLAKGDPDGIGVYVEPMSPTLSTGRRRSSQGTALKRRKSGEVGKSTNGQTVRFLGLEERSEEVVGEDSGAD
jgi:hypothetical protein